MVLQDDIVDIEKPDGICSLTIVADEFSELFLHPSIFSSEDIITLQKFLFWHTFHGIQVCFLS